LDFNGEVLEDFFSKGKACINNFVINSILNVKSNTPASGVNPGFKDNRLISLSTIEFGVRNIPRFLEDNYCNENIIASGVRDESV
jgi:hypothetical protein